MTKDFVSDVSVIRLNEDCTCEATGCTSRLNRGTAAVSAQVVIGGPPVRQNFCRRHGLQVILLEKHRLSSVIVRLFEMQLNDELKQQ